MLFSKRYVLCKYSDKIKESFVQTDWTPHFSPKNADNIVFVFLVLSYQDIPDIYLAQQKPNHVYRVGVVVVVSPTITVGLSLRPSIVWLGL